jgi:hypothetical protein
MSRNRKENTKELKRVPGMAPNFLEDEIKVCF